MNRNRIEAEHLIYSAGTQIRLPSNSEFQQRLDELGCLANEGALSDEERREYDTYIEAMDIIAQLRVKVLSRRREGQNAWMRLNEPLL